MAPSKGKRGFLGGVGEVKSFVGSRFFSSTRHLLPSESSWELGNLFHLQRNISKFLENIFFAGKNWGGEETVGKLFYF